MPAYAIGRALCAPDTTDADRWDRIAELVRDDEDFMFGADEYVAADIGVADVRLLAGLSGSRGLIRTLSVMPAIAALPAHHRDSFAALARLVDRIADEREKRINAETQYRFDNPEDDSP